MTIEELEEVCRMHASLDLKGRRVQVYDSDGHDWRNKFLLLSSVDVSGLSVK